MSMLTIGICLAASIGIILFTAKQRLDYNKQLSAYIESTKNHQKASFTKEPVILMGIMLVVAIGVLIYGISSDPEYFWIGLLLTIMTGTEFATLPIRFVLYYDDNSFLGEKGKVLYRNVKGYEFRKFLPKRGAVTIKLYNGEDIVVSYKVYQFIEQQIQLARERKKELKESRKKHAA